MRFIAVYQSMIGKDRAEEAERERIGPQVPGWGKTPIWEQCWECQTTASPLRHQVPLKNVTDPTYSLSDFPSGILQKT